jgi:hypothetical protein
MMSFLQSIIYLSWDRTSVEGLYFLLAKGLNVSSEKSNWRVQEQINLNLWDEIATYVTCEG